MLALALVLTLSACGGDEESAAPASPPPEPTATSAAPETGPTATAPASEAPAPSAKLEVDETIEDELLGDTIMVKGVVRNFPIPDRSSAIRGTREIVLVEVDLQAGEKFTGGLFPSALRIVTEDGGDANTPTTTVEPEMKEAGYEPVASRVGPGKREKGWIAFVVSPLDSKTLMLRFKRGASTVIGSGKSIPKKTFDVPLVK